MWENTNVLTKEQAIAKIKEMAAAQGFVQGFKVFYNGSEVVTQSALPAEVDMSLVKVASKLNNANGL